MGNFVSDHLAIREEGTNIGPALRTPFTDIVSPALHWDQGPCVSFESNYLNCLEAYGQLRGSKQCKLYYQDFMECTQTKKQSYRLHAMMTERWKQYVKGQLGMGPEVPHYAEPPPMDSYGANSMNDP